MRQIKTAKIALQKNPTAALALKIRAEIARKNGITEDQ